MQFSPAQAVLLCAFLACDGAAIAATAAGTATSTATEEASGDPCGPAPVPRGASQAVKESLKRQNALAAEARLFVRESLPFLDDPAWCAANSRSAGLGHMRKLHQELRERAEGETKKLEAETGLAEDELREKGYLRKVSFCSAEFYQAFSRCRESGEKTARKQKLQLFKARPRRQKH